MSNIVLIKSKISEKDVEFTPSEDRIGRVVDFDKRNLDSNTETV